MIDRRLVTRLKSTPGQWLTIERVWGARVHPQDPFAASKTTALTARVTIRFSPTDPNNIVGPAGYGDQNFVSVNQTLPYTIDFENEPTAACPLSR